MFHQWDEVSANLSDIRSHTWKGVKASPVSCLPATIPLWQHGRTANLLQTHGSHICFLFHVLGSLWRTPSLHPWRFSVYLSSHPSCQFAALWVRSCCAQSSVKLSRLNKEIRLCSWPEIPFTDSLAWKAEERRKIHIYTVYTLQYIALLHYGWSEFETPTWHIVASFSAVCLHKHQRQTWQSGTLERMERKWWKRKQQHVPSWKDWQRILLLAILTDTQCCPRAFLDP